MKDNKNQSTTLSNPGFTHQAASDSDRQTMTNRFMPQVASPVLEEASEKVMRRYSFDDNGGGYMGL